VRPTHRPRDLCQDDVLSPAELGLTGPNTDRRLVEIGGIPDRQKLWVEPDVFGWEDSSANGYVLVRPDRLFRQRKDGGLRPIPVSGFNVGDSMRIWLGPESSINGWVLAVAVIR